jgi:hypothetical protein
MDADVSSLGRCSKGPGAQLGLETAWNLEPLKWEYKAMNGISMGM